MTPTDLPAEMERIVRTAAEGSEPGIVLRMPDLRSYGRDDLHRYIDGAAERYLGYSFDRLLLAQAERAADAFVIELYHFRAPVDAYGIWSTDSVGEPVDVGQNSTYGGGLLQFWRGTYFARVYHCKYDRQARETVLTIGRALAAGIGRDAERPAVLAALPREGLKGAPVFFHEQPMLNHLYYLSDENLLRLGPDTDAVFAEHETADGKAKLLVVRYQGEQAREARKAFVRKYLETEIRSGPVVAQLENDLWTAIGEPAHRTLRVALDATTRDLALRLLKAPVAD